MNPLDLYLRELAALHSAMVADAEFRIDWTFAGLSEPDGACVAHGGLDGDEIYLVGKPRESLLFWWGSTHISYHVGQMGLVAAPSQRYSRPSISRCPPVFLPLGSRWVQCTTPPLSLYS